MTRVQRARTLEDFSRFTILVRDDRGQCFWAAVNHWSRYPDYIYLFGISRIPDRESEADVTELFDDEGQLVGSQKLVRRCWPGTPLHLVFDLEAT